MMRCERYGERVFGIYIHPMAKMILAPVESKRITTCLNVDKDEWSLFRQLMEAEGRSASDGVREMIRDTLTAKGRRRANA